MAATVPLIQAPRRGASPPGTPPSPLSDAAPASPLSPLGGGAGAAAAVRPCDFEPPPEFHTLCNDGRARKWGNLHTRLYRRLAAPVLRPILAIAMDARIPTNHSMLLARTANAAFGRPDHNDDWVAPLFLRYLMPENAKEIYPAPTLYARFRRALFQLPAVGIPGQIEYLDARTQWFDARAAAALAAGAAQVVVVAAGFDSTAVRHHRPGVRFFEIDLPHASAKKRALVDAVLPDAAAHPRPEYIGADLSEVPLAAALAGSGFDPALPTFWVVQGLVYYLPPAAFGSLLASIRALSAPGSSLAFDYIRLDVLSGARLQGGYEVLNLGVTMRGEPFLSGVQDAPGALEALAGMFGFRCGGRLGAREAAARFLPHMAWHEFPATVTPCFSFAEFVVD